MSNKNEPTEKKSIRIPNDVVADIAKEADKKFDGNFSDAAVFRMKHCKAPLTPAIMSKIQNITNTAVAAVRDAEPEKADNIQKEVDALWKYLK